MNRWHYEHDGRPHGPVSDAELRRLARAGALLPTDRVWRAGLAEWVPAARLTGLFSDRKPADLPSPLKPPPLPPPPKRLNPAQERDDRSDDPPLKPLHRSGRDRPRRARMADDDMGRVITVTTQLREPVLPVAMCCSCGKAGSSVTGSFFVTISPNATGPVPPHPLCSDCLYWFQAHAGCLAQMNAEAARRSAGMMGWEAIGIMGGIGVLVFIMMPILGIIILGGALIAVGEHFFKSISSGECPAQKKMKRLLRERPDGMSSDNPITFDGKSKIGYRYLLTCERYAKAFAAANGS